MKLLVALLICFAGVAGAASQEKPVPTQPDPEYCSRRDADPQKCLIQDGPPTVHVRKPPPLSPRSQAEKARLKANP